ncbi:hypothetical protein GYA54_03385 [Candidatus Kuenenbacteria bacterium]|nr:hypothetical protein [Candidatus Kuenenbacteria bacterium]
MNYQTKADKLTIKNPKGGGCSHVYIAPTDLSLGSGLGQLFIIAEIKSKEKKVPAILNQIVQELSEYYYHSPTKNSEAALETTCQYFNENIMEISQKNWQWLKERINMLMATIQENRLALSSYNNMRAWLVRDGKIHDISGSESENKKAVTPKKIMSQIISGQLEKDDIVMFSNATIFDYFAEDKIKKTITTLAPTQACAFLKNTLVDYKVAADFSTIVAKIISPNKNDRETAEAAPVNILQGFDSPGTLQQRERGSLAQTVQKIALEIKSAVNSAWQYVIKKIKDLSAQKFKSKEAPEKDKEETHTANLGFGKDRFATQGNWLKKFGAKEYRLVIFIIIIALAFVGSLKIISNKRAESAENKKIELAANEIKDKINSIEAALIYKDENKAQELFQEVQGILAELGKDDSEGAKAAYNELSGQIEAAKNKIYRLEKINKDAPFTQIPENVTVGSNAVIIEGNLYFAGGEGVYKINTKDGSISQTTSVAAGLGKATVFDNRQLVLYGDGAEMFFLDKGQGAPQKKILPAPANDKVVSTNIYNKKLYILGEKNIYSANYNNNNYETPAAWLKQEVSVSGNTAIMVDGNVWISSANGEVSKLFKGKKENFNLAGLYEPLSSQTTIYTNDALNLLYLVDKEKNRITIADKQGKVRRQILGDNLDKIISAIPSANEKELYILTEKFVYKLGL